MPLQPDQPAQPDIRILGPGDDRVLAAVAPGTAEGGIAALPVIRTPRLVLRPYRAGDAPDLQRLVGDAAVALNTVNIQHPYPDGAAAEWIAGHAAAAASGTSLTLAISDGTMEEAGMSPEGTHRQYFVRDGRGEDVVRYAILRSDTRRA